MCTPSSVIQSVFQAVDLGIKTANTIKQNEQINERYKYQTQIAINNAKQAQNEAMRQEQIGLEKSRLEKIKGQKQASLQFAKASASGFSATSETNLLNYDDINQTASMNAKEVSDVYKNNADNFKRRSNSYLNQARQYEYERKDALFKNGMNYLNEFSGVAKNWYGKDKDNGGEV